MSQNQLQSALLKAKLANMHLLGGSLEQATNDYSQATELLDECLADNPHLRGENIDVINALDDELRNFRDTILALDQLNKDGRLLFTPKPENARQRISALLVAAAQQIKVFKNDAAAGTNIERALNEAKSLKPQDYELLAAVLHSKLMYIGTKQPDRLPEVKQQIEEAMKALYAEDQNSYLLSVLLSYLGEVCNNLGDNMNGARLYYQAICGGSDHLGLRKQLGDYHPRTVTAAAAFNKSTELIVEALCQMTVENDDGCSTLYSVARHTLNALDQPVQPLSNQPMTQQEATLAAQDIFQTAGLEANKRNYKLACHLYYEALMKLEKVVGPFHSSLADHLFNLAWLLNLSGDYLEADYIQKRARKIREATN